jgi:signal transduction histidine kinase
MTDGRDFWGGRAEAARRVAGDRRAPAVTGLLLAVLAVVQVLAQATPGALGPFPPFFGILIALAATVPLGLLWPQPRAGAVVVSAACLLSLGSAHAFTVAGLIATLIATYRLGRGRVQLLSAGIAVVFLAVALAESAGQGAGVAPVVLAAGVPLAAWAGYAARERQDSAARDTESEAIAWSLLEHTARGERARISRELHDVVAHHISMISVQAESARLTTPGMPAAGAQRLAAISATARSALTEMRRLLGVLREDTRDEPVRRQPQPGLDQLTQLLDEARDATGAGTRLIISGWVTALDPGLELAAFRIVQEALTNSRRHAPGAAVDVELRYTDSALLLRIRDNGPGPVDGPAGGHGLLGMRERAAAVGGTLRTGGAAGGGFQVEALLPVGADEAVA